MRLWGQDTLFSLFTECSEHRASMVAQTINNLSVNARDMSSIPGLGRFPGEGNGNPLQYSCLEIPRTEEPGGLQSTGSQRMGHDWQHTDSSPGYRNTKTSLEQTPRPWVLCSLRMRNRDWIFQLNLPNLNNVCHYPSVTTEGKMSFPTYQHLTHKHPTSATFLSSTAWFPSFLLWEKTHSVCWGARSGSGAFRKLFNSQKERKEDLSKSITA